jgi:capsular polysaccharide biosynthesis protein
MVGAANPLDTAEDAYRGNMPSLKSAILFGFIGAAAMAVILVIAYLLDNRIRSKEEITDQYGIPVLSDIPNFNVKSKERYQTYYEQR